MKNPNRQFAGNVKWVFGVSVLFYAVAWIAHLVVATRAMRGFYGDAALAFLINLSDSYVFHKDNHWVHLFYVHFPRDFDLLLNAISLQVALWFGVSDPLWLKYIYLFWLMALPGFLYLILFAALARAGKLAWAIFPLLGWAVVSVPVDWNSINSTRCAVPIFWMHFFLVAFAGRRLRWLPGIAAIMLGAALLGGLYESVVAQAGLCLALGGALWWKEGNSTPLIYAAVAIPGAARALWSYLTMGQYASNGFEGFLLPYVYDQPYYLLMIGSLAMGLTLACVKIAPKRADILFGGMLGIVALAGFAIAFSEKPEIWGQAGAMRFDYIALSFLLMVVAAYLRFHGVGTPYKAAEAAAIALFSGALFWGVQIGQTADWQICRAGYQNQVAGSDIASTPGLGRLFALSPHIRYLDPHSYNECLWDWATPWTDLLTAPGGKVDHWPLFTVWQDFSFVQKENGVFLHTNNWTLTSPAMLESAGDLPVKTLLYDLTPLYEKLGLGEFVTHASCMPPQWMGQAWEKTFMSISDHKREAMFVCPRTNAERP